MRIPGIAGDAPKPMVAVCERPERKLCDKHGARFVQAFYDRGIFFNDLLFKTTCTPCCWIAFCGKKVFCAPRQSMERTAIFSSGDFTVRFFCLCEGALLGQSDHKF